MRILVIGGTRLVGRHLVQAAQARGHEVTLFNRGTTNPGLFPDVEHLTGDRDGGLDALGVEAGRTWDAVVDTCGYVPRVVRSSARLLAQAAAHYTFISSLSVYAEDATAGQDEEGRLAALADPTVEEITDETYGGLKVLCEREVTEAFPHRALILRCGLIVGPHDYTDRFPYWVDRVARGGEVLAPDPPEYRIQVIDARDLGRWIPFLLEEGVEPWSDLPMWLPVPKYAGVLSVDASKAAGAGLRFRPIEDTIEDTLAWIRSRDPGHEWTAGLRPEREARLLHAWKVRSA